MKLAYEALRPEAAGKTECLSFSSLQLEKRRRWESNPLDAALQAAATPCGSSVVKSVSLPGVEPGLRPSQSRVRSITLQGRILRTTASLEATPVASRGLLPTEESNLARLLRRQSCVLHTRRA